MRPKKANLGYVLIFSLVFIFEAQAQELPPKELLYQIEEFLSEETEDYVELVLSDHPEEKRINGTLIDSGIIDPAFHILIKPGPVHIEHPQDFISSQFLWLTLPQMRQFDSRALNNAKDFHFNAGSGHIFKHPPYINFLKKISPGTLGENKIHRRYSSFPLDTYHPETSPLPGSLPHNLMAYQMDNSFNIESLKRNGYLFAEKIKYRIKPLWRAKTFLHTSDTMYRYLTKKANVWVDESPYTSPLSPKMTHMAAKEIDRLHTRLKKVEARQKKIAQKKGIQISPIKRTGALVPTLQVELSPYQKLILIAEVPDFAKTALKSELKFSLDYGVAAYAKLGFFKPNLLRALIPFMGQKELQDLSVAIQNFYILDASIISELRQFLFATAQGRPLRPKFNSGLTAIHRALLVSDLQMDTPETKNPTRQFNRILLERRRKKIQFPYTLNDQEAIREYRQLEFCYLQQTVTLQTELKTPGLCQFPKLKEILIEGPYHLQMGIVDFLVKVDYYPAQFKDLVLDLLTRKTLNSTPRRIPQEAELADFDVKRSALVLTAAAVGYLRWKAPSFLTNLSENAKVDLFRDAIKTYQELFSLPPYTLPKELQNSIEILLGFLPHRQAFEKLSNNSIEMLDKALLDLSLAMTSKNLSFKDKIYLIWLLHNAERSNREIRFHLRDARFLVEGTKPGSYDPNKTTMWRHLRNLLHNLQKNDG